MNWAPVAGATGYRVSRATEPGGPYSTSADYDVAAGTSTKASGVTNVYFTSEFGFVYIEVITDAQTSPQRYYRVAAYNAAGAGEPSVEVCGSPPGTPAC